jgi:hypothetical protein
MAAIFAALLIGRDGIRNRDVGSDRTQRVCGTRPASAGLLLIQIAQLAVPLDPYPSLVLFITGRDLVGAPMRVVARAQQNVVGLGGLGSALLGLAQRCRLLSALQGTTALESRFPRAAGGNATVMNEPESTFERLRRAEREMGEPEEKVVEPIEETGEVAAAVDDEAPVPAYTVERQEDPPERDTP